MNFAVCGGKVFGTKKALTDELKIDINRYGMCFVNVNQGYAKCSTVIFADRAAITEDESIYKAMSSNGTDCLLIRKGYVRLDGFDYGFIGGASAVDEENKTIIFFGDIEKHPDYSLIKSFIEKYAYSIEYIREKPLTDVGGAIII